MVTDRPSGLQEKSRGSDRRVQSTAYEGLYHEGTRRFRLRFTKESLRLSLIFLVR
jgi:hypothetical protein